MINKTIKVLFNYSNYCHLHKNLFYFATQPKSHYDRLEIKPTFTQKQLRTQFLKKARELHPDHNQSKEAQQQFKLVKQAYEILKDPQKKYMHDTGISVEPGEQSPIHQQYNKNSRKYYQNKWYRYQRPKYQDARDQFYQKRSVLIEENIHVNRLIMLIFLVIGVFGYDYYYSRDHQIQMENKMAKELLEDSIEKKRKTIIMKQYIQTRNKEHIVQD